MAKDEGSGAGRGYHHGDLKEALFRAALELIAKKGPAGFTFAEAARWVGVSPAAPYRHFRDRDELLAKVALRGFNLFEESSRARMERRPAQSFYCFRKCWPSLPAVCSHRVGLLFGNV